MASVLYALSPREVGTPQAESLTSYVRRLAYAHVVSPSYLLREHVFEPARRDRRQRYLALEPTRATESVNDGRRVSCLVIERLSLLTGVGNLGRLVFRPAFGIDLSQAFRVVRAWCPRCLADGTPYDRLAWTLRVAHVCGNHGCLLVECCVRCGRSHRPWHASATPSACPYCGHTLAGDGQPCEAPTSSGVAANLVALAQRDDLPDRAQVAAAMSRALDGIGGITVAARRLGASKGDLSELTRGRVRPSLALVCAVISLAATSLDAFLCGAPRVRVENRPARRPSRPDRIDAVRSAMNRAARMPVPPSIRQIARRHHAAAASVRATFPRLAARIVARRKTALSARRQLREMSERELVKTLVAASADSHLAVSRGGVARRSIERQLPNPGMLRAPILRQSFRISRASVRSAGRDELMREPADVRGLGSSTLSTSILTVDSQTTSAVPLRRPLVKRGHEPL